MLLLNIIVKRISLYGRPYSIAQHVVRLKCMFAGSLQHTDTKMVALDRLPVVLEELHISQVIVLCVEVQYATLAGVCGRYHETIKL